MTRRAGFGCVLLAMIVVVAGCEEGDEAFVRDFMADWALNNPGSTLGGLVGVGDGNEVTAALGALSTIDNVNKADALMDEGREARDNRNLDGAVTKMDEAIKLRPRDWTYRTSRAVLALDRGSLSGYDADVKAAQELSPDRTIGGKTLSGSDREVRQRYDELRPVAHSLRQEMEAGTRIADAERCLKIFGEMAAMSVQLQNAARTAADQEAFDLHGDNRRLYGDLQAQCPQP
jgi:hypothetical protein